MNIELRATTASDVEAHLARSSALGIGGVERAAGGKAGLF